MHYSGILVMSRTQSIYDCVRELIGCPGVDVYSTDPATGRIVVVLETETLDDQEKGLRTVQNLTHVLSAELVYHYFGDDASTDTTEPTRSNP
jgi:nitrate reductase NapAB chaperone NapD